MNTHRLRAAVMKVLIHPRTVSLVGMLTLVLAIVATPEATA